MREFGQMVNDNCSSIVISKISTKEDVEFCARLRASMDPWITLQRGYDAAINSITNPDHEAYVAKMGSDIGGFLVLSDKGVLSGFMLTLCIVPSFQGHNIGSKLLDFCEKRIFQVSPNLFLLVSDFNTTAQSFYFRHGYQKVGELEDYVIKGSSEFLLRKSISPRNNFVLSK